MVEEVSVDVVALEEDLEEEDMEEGSEGEDSEVNKVDLEADLGAPQGSPVLPPLEVTLLVLVDSVTTNLGSFNLRPKSTSRT